MASRNVGSFPDKREVLGFWNLLVENLVLVSSPGRGIYKASRTKILAQPKWKNTTLGASKHETSQLLMSKATMNYSNDKLPVPFEEDYNAGPPQVLVPSRKA